MRTADVFIIGGGPAGMAAAVAAAGRAANVVLAEPFALGGRLLTHIEGGVGRRYGGGLTGPEYVSRAVRELSVRRNIRILRSAVVRVGSDLTVETAGGAGSFIYKAKAVVLACGGRDVPPHECFPVPAGMSGIVTASDALAAHCLFGKRVGRRAVIVGAGGDGLTAARRLVLEGTDVACVIERRELPGAGARMRQECLDDLHVPCLTSSSVIGLTGEGRVSGARVKTPEGEKTFRCDVVVCAAGRRSDLSLLPFVSRNADCGIAVTDSSFMTNVPGVFVVGGALHSCGICDRAAEEGAIAGTAAAEYAASGAFGRKAYWLKPAHELRYVIPVRFTAGRGAEICVRTTGDYKRGSIVLRDHGGNVVKRTDPGPINAGREVRVRLAADEVATNLFVGAEETE